MNAGTEDLALIEKESVVRSQNAVGIEQRA